MSIAERGAALLAQGCGLGRLQPGAGTWASLAAALVAAAVVCSTDSARLLLAGGVLLCCLIGLWAAPMLCRQEGSADPPSLVIDEVAGVWLAVALLPDLRPAHALAGIALAVALFRVLDIAKPWPVSGCERLPGGIGIMTDDLAAGAIASCLAAACLG
ncbi:MAG: phosphatidylglycerophosphatase A [Planctomycetota bacterium]|nr:phosphatidylglycerophosphatase A [Planctomycetota bacterium]MDW8373867.1 phosphatidylglycerophosphatase A [Planctomycetota bacterium]